MNDDTRPINLDLFKFKFPITAIVSIMHRISGVVLFVAMVFVLYALDLSLDSQSSFDALKTLLTTPLAKIVTWGIISALIYHFVAGIKHMLLDVGIGDSLAGGTLASRLSLLLSLVLICLVAIRIFL